jgi:hypothetical protein
MPKPGEPLFPEVVSCRQPFTVIDGQLQDPPFEGYVYSFENLLIPVEEPADSKEGWGNAYFKALNGKWPWE